MTEWEWGLVYLCWVIAAGSLVATGFTLRRLFEHRRERLHEKDRHLVAG